MSGPIARAAKFGLKIQSDFVLRTARGFYLIGAFVSLILVIVCLIVALIAQATTIRSASVDPVPQVLGTKAEAITFGLIDGRFAPPSNIRFVQEPGLLDRNISVGQSLGRFDADTPNGMNAAPNDFEIIGGDDAALFEPGPTPGARNRTGLRATDALAEQINQKRSAASEPVRLDYQLRVLARDAYGLLSKPTDISISIVVAPTGFVPPEEPATAAPTDIQALAKEIAVAVDPQKTDVYFDVQKRALQVPRLCGLEESPEFVTQYRLGFEHARTKLNANTVDLFFAGICDAWGEAVSRGDARFAQQSAAAAAAENKNAQSYVALELEKALAETIRNIALGAAAGALSVFLTLALFLAFLAMEGHSKALRAAVEALVVREGTNKTSV